MKTSMALLILFACLLSCAPKQESKQAQAREQKQEESNAKKAGEPYETPEAEIVSWRYPLHVELSGNNISKHKSSDPVDAIAYFEKLKWYGIYDVYHGEEKKEQRQPYKKWLDMRFTFNIPQVDGFFKSLNISKNIFNIESWQKKPAFIRFNEAGVKTGLRPEYMNWDADPYYLKEVEFYNSAWDVCYPFFSDILSDPKLKRSDNKPFDKNNMPGLYYWLMYSATLGIIKPEYIIRKGAKIKGKYAQIWLFAPGYDKNSFPYPGIYYFYHAGFHYMTYSKKNNTFYSQALFGRIHYRDIENSFIDRGHDQKIYSDLFKIKIKDTTPLSEIIVLKTEEYSIPFFPAERFLQNKDAFIFIDVSNDETYKIRKEPESDEAVFLLTKDSYKKFQVIDYQKSWQEYENKIGVWVKVRVSAYRGNQAHWEGWVFSGDEQIRMSRNGFYDLDDESAWRDAIPGMDKILRYSYKKWGDIEFNPTPEKDFIFADITENNTRLCSEPKSESEAITLLNEGEEVRVYESKQPDLRKRGWYRIRTAAGQEGWVYGAYLE